MRQICIGETPCRVGEICSVGLQFTRWKYQVHKASLAEAKGLAKVGSWPVSSSKPLHVISDIRWQTLRHH